MLLPSEPFSVPQLVRYAPSQKYDLHTDFWPEHQVLRDDPGNPNSGGVLFNRVASFFVFLRDNCTEGYTYFPLVEPAQSKVVEIEKVFDGKVARGSMEGVEQGVKFKPIRGNAIFWVNLDEHGRGDRRVVHAGLPVADGEKIGLNIWPRKFFGRLEGDDGGSAGKRNKAWSGKWKQ
jgi:prolyl 4-hydroxylase